jgi:PIN domain nuclease of toxin-antitoxin system
MLLDTNVGIRLIFEPHRVPETARALLRRKAATTFFSAASLWELSIKEASGKLPYPTASVFGELIEYGFTEMPVRARHGIEAGRLPRHHGDPFDRLLIAQARLEGLRLVTSDGQMKRYEVDLLLV